MQIETIKELIKEFKESDLTKLNLSCEAFTLELGREKEVYTPVNTEVKQVQVTDHQMQSQQTVISSTNQEVGDEENIIKSPMVGTFYEAKTPDAAPFVKVGDQVKKGDVLCIIEAMKLMNEVEAEKDGTIVEVLVQNEDMVEFEQSLFKIK